MIEICGITCIDIGAAPHAPPRHRSAAHLRRDLRHRLVHQGGRHRAQDPERRVDADEAPRGAPRPARVRARRTRLAPRLSEDGERLLDYARRIVRLNSECVASFNEADLTGRVRLGLPDDYAECYLPEILARFSRSNPRAEITVTCEPTPNLFERI